MGKVNSKKTAPEIYSNLNDTKIVQKTSVNSIRTKIPPMSKKYLGIKKTDLPNPTEDPFKDDDTKNIGVDDDVLVKNPNTNNEENVDLSDFDDNMDTDNDDDTRNNNNTIGGRRRKSRRRKTKRRKSKKSKRRRRRSRRR